MGAVNGAGRVNGAAESARSGAAPLLDHATVPLTVRLGVQDMDDTVAGFV
ncbi:hypothetical protein AURDEDRAFT_178554 [Auricularia subglabra TFB-10046 SS5]|uniref:Uncharacterized protein n=1 Tax=Auricularia subglabra (strain TFB-10046 / SS5) TaxID=717982 RepID=J0WKT4_AURST|nr:hypothetical protein AURDEDRAFT_178554 [Auricularia subglabra TFB-10046 SS5]